jgi:ABC-2 type transport system ATP-binding protein
MMRPAIELTDVHCSIDGRGVLAGVDLRVDAGEHVALLGARGAGKSALIRALLDLCALDQGTIRLDGAPHTGHSGRARLAYLPQPFQPPHYLRGRGFLEYMLALYGVRPADAPIAAVSARLGLDASVLEASVQTYSLGYIQRLGLAACLLSGRPVLVLDDPLSGLDAVGRHQLHDALGAHRDGAATVLFTTNDAAAAEALADRVAVLDRGRIAATGSPQALAQQAAASDLAAALAHLVGNRATALH